MIRTMALICAAGSLVAVTAGCGHAPAASADGAATTAAAPAAGSAQDRDAGAPGRGLGRGRDDGPPRRGFGAGGRGWGNRHVALTATEERVIGLKTVRADLHPLRSRLEAMGTVYAPPDRKAIVSYRLPARVARVHVRVGEWVRQGQTLVTLEAEEVGRAKTDLLQARAALELATSNHEREQRLLDRGVGARKAFLAAENDLTVARSSVDAARKRLQVLGLSPAEVEHLASTGNIDPVVALPAPIAGRITDSTPVIGSMVDPSTAILTILDPSTLCVDAEVYERDVAKLRAGQEVAVRVPAYPGETFTGRISYIGDVVKRETRTITVRTQIDNGPQRLKPGMFADVGLFLDAEAKVLALPERAVLDNQDEKLVFVKTGEGYLPQVVQLGVRHAGLVEIVRGLEAGDEIVLEGNYQLKSKLFDEVLKAAGHTH